MAAVAPSTASQGWSKVHTNTGVEHWVAKKLRLPRGQAAQVWPLKARLEREHNVAVFVEKRCAKHAAHHEGKGGKCHFGSRRCRHSHNLEADEVLVRGPAKGVNAAEKRLKRALVPVAEHARAQVLRSTADAHRGEVRAARQQTGTYLACVKLPVFQPCHGPAAARTATGAAPSPSPPASSCGTRAAGASKVLSLGDFPSLPARDCLELGDGSDHVSEASAATVSSFASSATSSGTVPVAVREGRGAAGEPRVTASWMLGFAADVERLAAMKAGGLLSDKEFAAAKAKVLGL